MKKICIIDDEHETLEIHKTYLEEVMTEEHEQAYEIVTFSNGEEALKHMDEVCPDVILLDIEMPFLGGFEVLDTLKNSRRFTDTPIIGVTGQRNKSVALSFLGRGASAYITKPVEKKLLIEKVAEIIRKEEEKKNRPHILLVDDDPESILVYKNMLLERYNVTALSSGKSALMYLKKFKPELIILDYQMPLYNGRAMYKMIKAMENVQDIPIMFLTGATEHETIMEITSLFPRGIVLKPANKAQLFEKIQTILYT